MNLIKYPLNLSDGYRGREVVNTSAYEGTPVSFETQRRHHPIQDANQLTALPEIKDQQMPNYHVSEPQCRRQPVKLRSIVSNRPIEARTGREARKTGRDRVNDCAWLFLPCSSLLQCAARAAQCSHRHVRSIIGGHDVHPGCLNSRRSLILVGYRESE